MRKMSGGLTPKQTFLWILVPMVATFAGQRLHLHLVGVEHVYPAGYLVHHLYTGALIVIPAAFILAFGSGNRLVAILARVALGTGSAMVLDEVVYLVATKASDEDFVSALSLWGAVILMAHGTILLLALYWLHSDKVSTDAKGSGVSAR